MLLSALILLGQHLDAKTGSTTNPSPSPEMPVHCELESSHEPQLGSQQTVELPPILPLYKFVHADSSTCASWASPRPASKQSPHA